MDSFFVVLPLEVCVVVLPLDRCFVVLPRDRSVVILTHEPLFCCFTIRPLCCSLTTEPLFYCLTTAPLYCSLTTGLLYCSLTKGPLCCSLTTGPLLYRCCTFIATRKTQWSLSGFTTSRFRLSRIWRWASSCGSLSLRKVSLVLLFLLSLSLLLMWCGRYVPCDTRNWPLFVCWSLLYRVCCCSLLLTLRIHYFTSRPWPQQNCPLWNN